jgi:hypothetical protein
MASHRRSPLVTFTLALSLCGVALTFPACGSSSTTSTPTNDAATGDGGDGSDGGDGACSGTTSACGAACVDLSSDPANCGTCGNGCGGTLCCAGACVDTKSCSFGPTAVSPNLGYVPGGEWLTIKGAGFAKGAKVFVGDGRAPTRVVDASTLLVQVPPGLAGFVDVRVEQAASSATLKGGYRYARGGIAPPWQQKPMKSVRGEDPGVAVLQDGRVLIAGGTSVPDSTANALDTAEIYTRSTDTVTSAANAMGTKRWQNVAVTLLTGKVLVVGGACFDDLTNCVGDAKKADLFDPATNAFTPTKSPLNVARAYPHAVLLPDGRVLIASANDASLELYDPDADSFTLLNAKQLHVFGFMVRLKDGRALFGTGDGGNKTAEVFDPDSGVITSVGPLVTGRSMLTAHTLPDGRVLVLGGSSVSAGAVTDPIDTMEFFDPKTNSFSLAKSKLSVGRTWHASALVRDGSVLVMGDATKPFAKLLNPNTEWVAVTMLDGSVLGVGGGACGTSSALPDLDFLAGTDTPQ